MQLSMEVARQLEGEQIKVFTKCWKGKETSLFPLVQYTEDSVGEWAGKQMKEKHTLLFIGACGIAVRAIAPYVTNKLQDSAILVMDENGNYIIPVLSGHFGGANELAEKIAKKIGAIPVLTTATDLNKKFAVDLFAKRNGLCIVNKDGIAKVSSKVLAGEEITIAAESGHFVEGIFLPKGIKLISASAILEGQRADVIIDTKDRTKEALLWLKPKEYVIGIGCKRGKEEEKINALILKKIAEYGISVDEIVAVASIDKKREEQGILAWCRKQKIPFITFEAEPLQKVQGDFSVSDFVKEQVGVDNVCERAALRACEYGGSIISKKYAEDGMTIAIAKREWRLVFDGK